MPAWRPALDTWFATHHGVISLGELNQIGVGLRTVRRMQLRGELVSVMPGVFRSSQFPETRDSRMRAACARNPAVLVALTAALKVWKFRRVTDGRLHVMAPHGCSPELPGIVLHRCRKISPVDIVERPDGIRLTSPPRSIFDSADLLGVSATRSIVEQAIHEGMCTLGTIVDTFTRLAHPSRPGTNTMAEVLASRPKWRKALHSNHELIVLEMIERAGLPRPDTQCPVVLPDSSTIHLDFGWPDWKVGIEVDDPAWHAGFEERHRDTRRDRKAAVVGWLVPRVTKLDIDGDLRDAVEDVRTILGQRGWTT